MVWQVQHQGDEDSEHMSHEGDVTQRFQEPLATGEPEDSENLDGHFDKNSPTLGVFCGPAVSNFRHHTTCVLRYFASSILTRPHFLRPSGYR